MGQTALRRDETIALGVAVVLHFVLAAALLMQPEISELPDIERVSVSLAEDVGLEASAPMPVPESRAATAPTLSEMPQPIPAPVVSEPIPAPRAVATQPPRPAASRAPRPRPTRARSTPAPAPRATSSEPRRRPDRPTSRPAAQQPSGASRLGDNFLEGAGASAATTETRLPASQIGNSAKASLLQALSRQLKPHWSPPSGPEVDEIVSVVSFSLNENGSLAGTPRLRRQTGVNATNQAQAGRHGEQAIRAVQLAAPFDLPDEYYEAWKRATISFDWKLSQ